MHYAARARNGSAIGYRGFSGPTAATDLSAQAKQKRESADRLLASARKAEADAAAFEARNAPGLASDERRRAAKKRELAAKLIAEAKALEKQAGATAKGTDWWQVIGGVIGGLTTAYTAHVDIRSARQAEHQRQRDIAAAAQRQQLQTQLAAGTTVAGPVVAAMPGPLARVPTWAWVLGGVVLIGGGLFAFARPRRTPRRGLAA